MANTTNAQPTSMGLTLLGFTLGSLVGITAGLLFAPKSGIENQEYVRRKVQESRAKMREKADKAAEAAKQKTQDVADSTTAAIEDAQQKSKSMTTGRTPLSAK